MSIRRLINFLYTLAHFCLSYLYILIWVDELAMELSATEIFDEEFFNCWNGLVNHFSYL